MYKSSLDKYDQIFESNQLIYQACKSGNLEVVKILLKQGLMITVHHNHCLRLACRYGHLEVVKFLIDNGADLNEWHGTDCALVSAIYGSHLEIIKFLIEHGAIYKHYYIIELAMRSDLFNLEVIKLLLDNGLDEKDVFLRNCRLGCLELFNLLIDKITNIEDYISGLEFSSASCHYDIVKRLIDKIINITDNKVIDNALHVALDKAVVGGCLKNNQLEVIELLLEKGAQVSSECLKKAKYMPKVQLLFANQKNNKYYGILSKSKLDIKLPDLEEINKNNVYYYVYKCKYENGGYSVYNQHNKYNILSQFGKLQFFNSI